MSAYISSAKNFHLSGPSLEAASVTWVSGAARGEDRVQSDNPTSLPSQAEMRAFRAELASASAESSTTRLAHPVCWTPQAILCAAHSGWQAPPVRPVPRASNDEARSALPAGHTATLTPPEDRPSNAELWYAQRAVSQSYQQREQLSFRPLRPRDG